MNRQQEIQAAQEHVETCRYSGLVRHYSVGAVQDEIEFFTGVQCSADDVKAIVNIVRAQNGWGPATYLDEEDDDQ